VGGREEGRKREREKERKRVNERARTRRSFRALGFFRNANNSTVRLYHFSFFPACSSNTRRRASPRWTRAYVHASVFLLRPSKQLFLSCRKKSLFVYFLNVRPAGQYYIILVAGSSNSVPRCYSFILFASSFFIVSVKRCNWFENNLPGARMQRDRGNDHSRYRRQNTPARIEVSSKPHE
jgi:hypothetical protein